MRVGLGLRLQELWRSQFEAKPTRQPHIQQVKDINPDSDDSEDGKPSAVAGNTAFAVTTLGYRDESITVSMKLDKKGRWIMMKANEQFDPKEDTTANSRPTSILDPYCMVVTRYYDRFGLLTHTNFEIQAAGLVRLIREIVLYYSDDSFRVGDTIKFEDPPKLLYYYRKELEACKNREDVDSKTKTHIGFALNFLYSHMGGRIRKYEEFLSAGMINFADLWMLFKPGLLVYEAEIKQLYFLKSSQVTTTMCGTVFELTTQMVDFDGEKLGKVERTLQINAFENPRMLTSLSVLPLDLCDNPDAIKKKLLIRAARFLELRGIHNLQHKTKGRVMVDAKTFLRHVVPGDEDRAASRKKGMVISESCKCVCAVCKKQVVERPEDYDHAVRQISEDEMLLCSSLVLGFQLSFHKWITLRVDDLEEIAWSEDAINRLVIEDRQKKVLSSLINSPIFTSGAAGDVIDWKGRGLVMLLHGQPGTGKTLTAESVCESLKRPLYIVSGGELGITPVQVEKSLVDILELSKQWKAVILIDEADVFLEQRSAGDIVRNNFVSVFLRRLEYFTGILLLTTNRVTQFDEAFISRIHLAMNYPPLEPWMRKEVWLNGLRRFGVKVDEGLEKELEAISKVELNGRVISYSVRTAKAMADEAGEELGVRHLWDVVGVQKKFAEVMSGTQGSKSA